MSLINLQKKIGVNPDGDFGPTTIKAAKAFFKMSDNAAANFFAQTSHESQGFTKFTENLNYSKDGLQRIFKKYFTPDLAKKYERKPELIANRVYASRMGNGPESSGDGWKYRGRGSLQLTGKTNYQLFSNSINKPEIMNNPDLISTEYAFESAMWFFTENKIWPLCENSITNSNITLITRKINGGTIGLSERIELTHKFYDWLK